MTAATQNLGNHTRYFPPFHFVAVPLAAVYAIYATYSAITGPSTSAWFAAAFGWAVVLGLLTARAMVVRVQDRLIRLEETLRMQRVLPAELQHEIGKLTSRQFVALRFASDDELPHLMRRTLSGEFADQKAIKQAIKVWRADWLRA